MKIEDNENLEKGSCSYYYINGELSIFVDNEGKIYLVKYDGNKEKYFELSKTKKLLKFLEIEEWNSFYQ